MKALALSVKQNLTHHAKYIFVMALVLSIGAMSFAQTAISVDTDAIFAEVNNWIVVFLPIVAIGIGISVALAILTFIGKQIVNAFH